MNPTLQVTFCGRTFTAQETELMRAVVHEYARLGVTEIARTICELLEWKRPGGGLKNHECRQLLERLQAEGVLTLGPGAGCVRGSGMRTAGVGPSGRQSGEPLVARAHGTLSLSGVPRAVRGEPALLGAESRAGTGLPVVDIARLENAASGRVDRVERGGAATQLATDRQ